jgi:pteridine reductase
MANKVALVTGGAQRIGAIITRILHENQYNVVIHYHTSSKAARALCTQLNQLRKNSAITLRCDLTHLSTLPLLIKKTIKPWGKLNALIHNASSFYKTIPGKTTSSEWDTLINTNLKAPYFLSQAARPFLKKTKGSIIHIADIHGERPMKDYTVYSVSKAGLLMLTKSLARELAPHIRVNAVSPGISLLPEGKNTLTPALKKKIVSRIPLQSIGNPKDIARAVLFLIEDAHYITGQNIAMDGGRLLFI